VLQNLVSHSFIFYALPYCYTAKERSGYSGSAEDSSKFDNPWRREGPLPTRDSSRRRHDTPERQPPSLADEAGDWRSNRPQRLPEPEPLPYKRKSAGFVSSDPQVNAADKGDAWTIGSKFKPDGSNEDVHSKLNSTRGRSDMGPPKESLREESDWRSSARPRPTRSSVSRMVHLYSAFNALPDYHVKPAIPRHLPLSWHGRS
jgi:translation initiation factor 4B